MSLDQPRFRRDLEAVPLEADGQRYVDVRDPTTGVVFRLYDFEYHVALAFDGLTFDTIIPWLKLAAGITVEPPQLRDFAARLDELGFLERDEGELAAAPASATEQAAVAPTVAAPDESLAEVAATSLAEPEASPEIQVPPAPPSTASEQAAAPIEEAAPEEATRAPDETTTLPEEAGGTLGEANAAPEETSARAEAIRTALEQVSSAPEERYGPAEETDASPDEAVAAPAEAYPPSYAPLMAEESQGQPDDLPPPASEATFPTEAGLSPDDSGGPVAPTTAEAPPGPGEETPSLSAPVPTSTVPEEPPVAHESVATALEEAYAAAAAPGPSSFEDGAPPAFAPEGFAPSEEPSPPSADGTGAAAAEGGAEQAGGGAEETYGVPEAIFTPRTVPADMLAAPDESLPPPDEAARSADLPPRPLHEETFAATAGAAAWTQPPLADTPEEPREEPALPRDDEPHSSPGAPAAAEVLEADAGPAASPMAEPPAAEAEPAAADEPEAPESVTAAEVEPPRTARLPDSTAFPVLPVAAPRSVETPPPASVTPVVTMPLSVTPSPRMVTPSPRVLPPPYVTPSPATLGPLPVAVRRRQRRSLLLFGSLGILTAASVLAIVLPFFFPPHGPPRASVRTLTALPGPIVRYFASTGTVAPLPGPVLKFPVAGKVLRVAQAGTVVVAGDVVAAVEGARPLLSQLARQKERLAFYQQMAEGMRQAGNTVEEERQVAKVGEGKARVAKTLRFLAQVAVVATAAGTVEEAFAREGDVVEAGSLALRLGSSGHRATFDLPSAQAAEARRLGFCQVGVDGHLFDCTPSPERTEDGRVSVEVSALPAALVGRPARLARARWGGAVALPASAVQRAGRRAQVLVVSPSGRVEVRPVTVAEQSATEAIVIQGLDPGDNVIVAPAANLRPGVAVTAHS